MTFTDSDVLTTSVIAFTINEAPSQGSLSMSGSSGTTLRDSFSGIMVNWFDENEDYPLTYSFSWVNGTYSELTSEEIADG